MHDDGSAAGRAGGLTTAAFGGDLLAIVALVAAGADVNETHPGSALTPISAAIENSELAAVRLLLELGADPGRPDGVGMPPLHRAIDIAIQTAIRMFDLTGNRGISTEIIELLLDAGADPSATDGEGVDAVELCDRVGNSVAKEVLLRHLSGRPKG